MTEQKLDLAAYEQDVVQHLVLGLARARTLEAFRGDKPWNVDLTQGVLTLGSDTYKAQVLGTFAYASKTFLWAWANPGCGAWSASLSRVNDLRKRALQPGQAVFGQEKVAAAWVHPHELTAVCGELAGKYPVFVGAYDGGEVYLLVTDVDLDLSIRDFSLAYLPGVLLRLSAITTSDAKSCVTAFGKHLGFVAVHGSNTTYFTREDDSFEVSYDAEGRINRVSIG